MTEFSYEFDDNSVEAIAVISKNKEQKLRSAAEFFLYGPLHDIYEGSRSGKVYKKPGGGTYVASAPGEPPASSDTKGRTGTLKNSWEIWPSNSSQIQDEIIIGTESPYAALLEEGTKYMAAREHLKPAWDNGVQGIKNILSSKWDV